MPNAKTEGVKRPNIILALGTAGSGKTSQVLTLPGKKFAYLFDQNALLSLRGHDVDYEEFYPGLLPLNAHSLKKGATNDTVMRGSSEVYRDWEMDFSEKYNSGFFDPYDTIVFDSATTLLDLILDRILSINGRSGQWPQQDDWGPQMVIFVNIMRTLTSMGKLFYLTGHLSYEKDELTQRIYRLPIMTGKLKEKIPILFSDVFVMEAVNDGKGNVKYNMQTVPDQRTPTVRCSVKGLKPFEDITLDWSKPLDGQGLGGILKRQ